MRPRDDAEPNRSASGLELFFDLVFVVAIATAATHLHHAESGQHIWAGIGSYLMVFFAIWWAWMNFTWFATAFDTDDWLYRMLTILQMGGVLVVAAGAGPAMAEGQFLLIIIGYVIMRLVMVIQWLRASRNHARLRRTTLTYAGGIAIMQCLWVAWLFLPEEIALVAFLALVAGELAVPIVAERRRTTPWHPHHIAERYSLFIVILLGESVLASTNAFVEAAQHSQHLTQLIMLAGIGLIMAAGMWWIYFSKDNHDQFGSIGNALTFGYGHYIVFAAAGAFSAGIGVAVDQNTNATDLAGTIAAATLTVPVSIYILGVWWLTLRPNLPQVKNIVVPGLGVLLGTAALLPAGLPVAAVLMIGIVVTLEIPEHTTEEETKALSSLP
ncbi:low temperature requirement protein A [Arthrobacter castelli]|uniref:low temperature requirement protein A n=1 Tax=Arthrobacter castelli TaxID=271431 RepID=UPI00040E8742|nr:low temperature requirement protein A [Arthrobacter castelli]